MNEIEFQSKLAELMGEIADPETLGNMVANALRAQGANEILAALAL